MPCVGVADQTRLDRQGRRDATRCNSAASDIIRTRPALRRPLHTRKTFFLLLNAFSSRKRAPPGNGRQEGGKAKRQRRATRRAMSRLDPVPLSLYTAPEGAGSLKFVKLRSYFNVHIPQHKTQVFRLQTNFTRTISLACRPQYTTTVFDVFVVSTPPARSDLCTRDATRAMPSPRR